MTALDKLAATLNAFTSDDLRLDREGRKQFDQLVEAARREHDELVEALRLTTDERAAVSARLAFYDSVLE